MTLSELHRKFGTQDKCIAYLEKLRWSKQRACILCGSVSVKKRKKSIRWHCNDCNRDFSVLMGTIFEGTRLPLPKFFEIIFLMNNAKMGISAAEIARAVGVKYQTSWYACHRVRCAMIDSELRLEGMVEFDEAYLGGKPRKRKLPDNTPSLARVTEKRGRGTKKVPVVGAVEKKGKVYVKIVEKLSSRNLLAMLKQVVKTDESIVITDDFKSYKQFDKEVEHITIKHSEGYGKGIKTVNTIEGFWSIIKNGIKGSYRSISKKYLPFYLAEFSYKFNNRHLQKNGFETILINTVKDEKCMLNYKPVRDTKEIAYGKRTQKKCLS
ncbi:MAG: IS1595 family transposase [Bacteroidota bacterium]